MLSLELASVALGRRVFAVLLGVAFAVSAGLCVYASQSADPVIGFRTAVQISGWLCVLAVFVGFCARVPRNRRDLGEVTAAATGFFTGAAMLYLAHFQWSELPTAPASPAVAKIARPVWNPAASVPPAIAKTGPSASAGGSAPQVVRIAPGRLPQPMAAAAPVAVAAAPVAAVPVVTKEDNCGAGDDAGPACPSVIPASPPQ